MQRAQELKLSLAHILYPIEISTKWGHTLCRNKSSLQNSGRSLLNGPQFMGITSLLCNVVGKFGVPHYFLTTIIVKCGS